MARLRTPTALLELRGAFKRNPNRKQARQGEPLVTAPLADPPEGMTISRVEQVSALVLETVSLHIADEGKSEQGGILAVVFTSRTYLIGSVAWPIEGFSNDPFKRAVVIDKRNQPTGLPFSTFCHRPAAEGCWADAEKKLQMIKPSAKAKAETWRMKIAPRL